VCVVTRLISSLTFIIIFLHRPTPTRGETTLLYKHKKSSINILLFLGVYTPPGNSKKKSTINILLFLGVYTPPGNSTRKSTINILLFLGVYTPPRNSKKKSTINI